MTKCLLVDDESPAIALLKNHIETLGNLEIVACCYSAIEAFDVLKTAEIDLLFLDIEMPVLKGLDFLRALENPPKVIVTTAYRDYAIEGYDLDIIDYLLKPISFQRFVKAMDRYYERLKVSLDSKRQEKFFYVNINKKQIKIVFDDILYIESLKDYVRIHTTSKRFVVKSNIGKIEALLPSELFVRTHRSFISSINKITAFTQKDVEIGGLELPIGPKYAHEVFRQLSKS